MVNIFSQLFFRRDPPSDEFQVDSIRHMVSLLTMLGPSPDWNVGLSQESMCTSACGWMGSRVSVDLFVNLIVLPPGMLIQHKH